MDSNNGKYYFFFSLYLFLFYFFSIVSSDDIFVEPVPDLEMAIKRSMLAKNKLAMIVKQPDGGVSYSCVECTALFLYKEELEQHLLLHNREYRYLCGICGTGYVLNFLNYLCEKLKCL